MNALFKLLGILLIGYIAVSLHTGSIFAKSGPWGRTYHRDEEPRAFWTTVVVYCLLAVALLIYF